MRAAILTAILAAGAAGVAHAAADVKVTEGHVWIRAVDAPLGEILERLQEQTGMKVIYDGPRLQQAVGLTIEDQTLTAALSSLLDAQGIKYAIALNAAGTKVATLLITTTGSPAASHPAARSEAPPPPAFSNDEGAWVPPPPIEAPPPTMPTSPPPTTVSGPAVSPFTPQGPGPVVIPMPGAAPPPGADSSLPPRSMTPPPVMTPLPGPSTAERPPWEK